MVRPPMNYAQLTQNFAGSGQWDRMVEAARDWVGAEPENPAAHRALAQALVNLGRHAEAEPHIVVVLARRPEDGFAHRLASIIHFGLKRPQKAEEAILKAISLAPRDNLHWHQLALMCYEQGDRINGLKWAEKARELAPNNAATLNLLSLCQPATDEGRARKRSLLSEALALRPNDPNLQNNLGVLLLGAPRDLAGAEACFRRALGAVPTSPLYRRNLFVAIRGRDWVYRALRAPLDGVRKVQSALRPSGRWRFLLLPVLILVWIFAARIFGAILVIWAVFFWPMLKLYEFMVIGDLRKKAGEIGAQRGGFLGYRRWSLRLRLGIVGAVMLVFWAALAWTAVLLARGSAAVIFAAMALSIVVLVIMIVKGFRKASRLPVPFSAWMRSRKVKRLLRAQPTTT
jgi:tetratricopeptide (TPR) repeat protein